jgi:hypothetical protein
MAIKHVKEYYKQIEKMYLELSQSLVEMEKDYKAGEATEEELNNLLLPVRAIQDNYMRLSYIMHLLVKPNRESKAKKFDKQNSKLNDYFKEHRLDKESTLSDCADALKIFKEKIKEKK